jgi:hypothetical protein
MQGVLEHDMTECAEGTAVPAQRGMRHEPVDRIHTRNDHCGEREGMHWQNAIHTRNDHCKGVWGKGSGPQRGCRGQRHPAAGCGAPAPAKLVDMGRAPAPNGGAGGNHQCRPAAGRGAQAPTQPVEHWMGVIKQPVAGAKPPLPTIKEQNHENNAKMATPL